MENPNLAERTSGIFLQELRAAPGHSEGFFLRTFANELASDPHSCEIHV
jgi:hypothetical protein